MALKSVFEIQNSDKGFIIDSEDYDKVKNHKWYLDRQGYVCTYIYDNTTQKQTKVRLHKLLVDYPIVDHKDRDKLNNCKSNLRKATRSQNMMNRDKFRGTSKFKGVHFSEKTNKWVASISIDNVQINLGSYDTQEQAGLKYNLKAKELHKEFAVLNDIPLGVTLPKKNYKGVFYDKKRNKYVATLFYKGEQLLYKRCETQKEALELRNEYARKYNLKEQEWVGEI